MIIFAAFTPHSPLLIPGIGKENLEKLSKTQKAMQKLEEELVKAKPDTIVIVSSHSTQFEKAFCINLHDKYHVDLQEFGDLVTTSTFFPDLSLMDAMQRHLRKEGLHSTFCSDEKLEYGVGVPLLLLTEKLSEIKIVPISYSGLDPQKHVSLGNSLKELLSDSNKRIALIASGDLSHCLTSEAPEGFRKEGKLFDAAVHKSIEKMDIPKLTSIKPEIVEAAAECGYRSLLILLGTIERMHVKPEVLAYEAPFGVGYLTAQFHFL